MSRPHINIVHTHISVLLFFCYANFYVRYSNSFVFIRKKPQFKSNNIKKGVKFSFSYIFRMADKFLLFFYAGNIFLKVVPGCAKLFYSFFPTILTILFFQFFEPLKIRFLYLHTILIWLAKEKVVNLYGSTLRTEFRIWTHRYHKFY